jgi:3-hydroxyisobutyrate dehydrogenase-like beta-hydroxyacid dehydrogenase
MASSDAQLPPNIGFIGLGNMGFPMFSNLVSKLPETSTVHFYDVLPESMERGLKESGAVAKLDPCGSSREVVEKSVCTLRKLSTVILQRRQDACFSSLWSLTEHL